MLSENVPCSGCYVISFLVLKTLILGILNGNYDSLRQLIFNFIGLPEIRLSELLNHDLMQSFSPLIRMICR